MVSVGSGSSHAHSVSSTSIPEGKTSGEQSTGDYGAISGDYSTGSLGEELKMPHKPNPTRQQSHTPTTSDYSYNSNLTVTTYGSARPSSSSSSRPGSTRPLTPMPNSRVIADQSIVSHRKLNVKKTNETVGVGDAPMDDLMICDDGWGAGSCEPGEGEL